MTITRPDVDLTDGAFYAGDSRAVYRWMRENEPVFRDRNGLAAASTYQAVIEAERNPELFSNAGGIRPDQDPIEMMIEMDAIRNVADRPSRSSSQSGLGRAGCRQRWRTIRDCARPQ